jgi:threonine/homoserine/homoserine lactone efflux protein
MLTQAIGDLLPAAVGVALSPIPIIAVVLMLSTPRARTNGPAFALGWAIGLTAASLVVLVLASGADDPDSASATGTNWVQVALGVLLLVLAARQWRRRPAKGERPEMPKWMETIDTFTPRKSFVLGVLLSAVNPKNLALTVAAAASISQDGLDEGEAAVAVAVFVVLASTSVAGLVLFYLIGGERAAEPLDSIKEFMADHNAVIMMVILLVLGAKVLGEGFAGVTN